MHKITYSFEALVCILVCYLLYDILLNLSSLASPHAQYTFQRSVHFERYFEKFVQSIPNEKQ